MKRVFVLIGGFALLIFGCDAAKETMAVKRAGSQSPSASEGSSPVYRESSISTKQLSDNSTAAAHVLWRDDVAFRLPEGEQGPPAPPAKGEEKPAVPGQPLKAEAPPVRRIIRTGNVELVVPDLDGATLRLQKLVEDHKGFIAHSDVRGTKGERRTASWTIRIPADEYQATMDSLPRLGELLGNRTDSQDVSEEYYDIEARLKNKQVEEKRLLEHLQKSTGKLDEILAVEKELSRVREEIERFQGRLNKLSNLTSLTTITISMQEIKDYVPPSSPSFGTSVSRTFDDSAGTLGSFLRNIVLFAVAVAPWLPLVAVVIGLPWWLIRRRVRNIPTVSPALPTGNQS
jgi:hypothetical protein